MNSRPRYPPFSRRKWRRGTHVWQTSPRTSRGWTRTRPPSRGPRRCRSRCAGVIPTAASAFATCASSWPRARPASRRSAAAMDTPVSGMPEHASNFPAPASGVPMRAASIRRAPIFPETRSFNVQTTESLKPMPKSSSISAADEGFGPSSRSSRLPSRPMPPPSTSLLP